MSQKNETPILILSLLITLGLIGGGIWWLTSRFGGGGSTPSSTLSVPEQPNSPTASLPDRFSAGTRLLVAGASPDKQAGVAAIAAKNYSQAITALEASLQANRNDPEALIYLNNARIGDQKSYTIAVATPLATSPNPALEILRGVAQAQDEVNRAGGMNGVPLKVLLVSDDNDPAIASQVAQSLTQDGSVLGVIGHFGSDATLAAAPVYQQAGLVMVSPTSTSVGLSDKGDYIFRTVPSDRFTAAALSRYMVNQLKQQDAAIYFNSGSDYSKSLKDEFTTALYGDGGQLVGEFDLANPAFNVTQSLNEASQKGAKILVLAANTATLDQALAVIKANAQSQNLKVLGGDSIYNPKILEVGGADAVGLVVAVPWAIQSDQAPFVQASRALWGGFVNWRTAMAYDATKVLTAALQRDPSRKGVQQALADSNFAVDGATGTVRFLPSGDRNQATQLVVVQPGGRSQYGYDFVPVVNP